MTISQDEAAQALGEIAAATGRLREVTVYAYSAPYLILVGIAWMVADSATWFAPRAEFVWPMVTLAIWAGCISVAVTQRRRLLAQPGLSRPRTVPALGRRAWAPLATAVTSTLFMVSLIFVLWPLDFKQVHTMWGLAAGFGYVAMGVWLGWRLLALGVGLVGVTVLGFYGLTMAGGYPLFMGLVSGGAMILGGLWLRKI
jgi:hypothetical protein